MILGELIIIVGTISVIQVDDTGWYVGNNKMAIGNEHRQIISPTELNRVILYPRHMARIRIAVLV